VKDRDGRLCSTSRREADAIHLGLLRAGRMPRLGGAGLLTAYTLWVVVHIVA
jgi:hypothetical protein